MCFAYFIIIPYSLSFFTSLTDRFQTSRSFSSSVVVAKCNK
ncbi:hypothetical protein [Gilvibacter sp.]